jgi:hypothetical protein
MKLDLVWMVYSGDTSVVMRGQVSGRVYLFPPHPQTLEVDARDVPALLHTRRFLRSE